MRTVVGPTDRVVIVGAGLGGLSAALHLAGAGRQVTILERAAVPGGRCGLLADGGYAFDTGPSVLTMPEFIDEALAAVGETLADRLTLLRLDPAYRARFADGSTIDVHTDTDAMTEEIRTTCGARDADGYRRMVRWLSELYESELPNFIDRNIDSSVQLLRPPLLNLLRLGAWRRLAPAVERFVGDERLQRLFTFQSMYAGLSPTEALAIYSVITYMDCVAGVFFPVGGMHAVPRALAAAAQGHGVDIRYETGVTRIDVVGDRATSVITASGERIVADVVVVNADAPTAYQELLPERVTPRRMKRLRYSPSCVVLHAGSGAQLADTHHTISFGRAWRETFSEIIDDGATMSDPSFLLTSPTRSDPSLAPAGKHSYYALFPAPNVDPRRGDPIDWRSYGPRYRDHILATLDARGFTGLSDGADVEHLVTPADWLDLGLAAGAPFAAAHTVRQTGPFRLPTLDRTVGNLVFCGSSTQPGVGVPMVLLSGRLAAERVTGAVRGRSANIA